METGLQLVSTGAHESCQTDYLSVSFRLPTEDAQDELYAYCHDLAEKILPTGGFLEPTKGRYFQYIYKHRSGLSLETSPVSSKTSTAGFALVNLPGEVWQALDASERRDLIIDLRSWPGFYRATRWDPQITVLNPEMRIERLIDEIADGRIWLPRFAESRVHEKRDRNGERIDSPTQYIGSTKSTVMLRCYDHGYRKKWDEPSLRIEAQLRKDVADQHFRRLAERCYTEQDADPLFVGQEMRTVKDALAQHADFRDTSQWVGRPKPRKWAQTAPPAPFWTEMLSHEPEPLTIGQKAELDWDQTMAALKDQYGRKFALWVARESCTKGKETAEVLHDFLIDCAGRLKRGDEDLLASQVPRPNKGAARDFVKTTTRLSALREEGLEDVEGTRTPMGNTGVEVPLGHPPEAGHSAESRVTSSDFSEKDPVRKRSRSTGPKKGG